MRKPWVMSEAREVPESLRAEMAEEAVSRTPMQEYKARLQPKPASHRRPVQGPAHPAPEGLQENHQR
ncbi:hypothetical protein NDU88_001459 [Pleurodeles waltl]|uniref:Uncharacterized protein n=1 Tax=Pleurodeles waltl TaxID=8319 RepID=A0AAV7SCC4_PLEWA|nr:hypothetical protein NDU88_001459 [Pleurodeles waltl]